MTEGENRFCSVYRDSLSLILLEQIPLGILSVFMLDEGFLMRIYLFTLVGFWTGFAMMMIRRPKAPTKLDIFLIKWGTFILFAIVIVMATVIWRWRGVMG